MGDSLLTAFVLAFCAENGLVPGMICNFVQSPLLSPISWQSTWRSGGGHAYRDTWLAACFSGRGEFISASSTLPIIRNSFSLVSQFPFRRGRRRAFFFPDQVCPLPAADEATFVL